MYTVANTSAPPTSAASSRSRGMAAADSAKMMNKRYVYSDVYMMIIN